MIAALFVVLVGASGFAQSSPEAIECVEKFIAKVASVKGYSLHLQKRELYEGAWLEEPIELWTEDQVIKYKFVADGSTGIKNNGMTLVYNGTETLSVIWGEPTFLGALANKAAKSVVGDTLPLADEMTLKGEIFTLNRAGYRHMAAALKYHMPSLKEAKQGGLKTDGGCKIKHTPPTLDYITIKLKDGMKIQDIEDKYGTFAYHIRVANSEKFPTLLELFKHKGEHEIRIPQFFPAFELNINSETGFPEKLVIYHDGQKIADYDFSKVKSW